MLVSTSETSRCWRGSRRAAQSAEIANLFFSPGRSFQIIAVLIAGYVATKFNNTRLLMCTVGNVICVIATALLSFLPSSMTWVRLVSFWMINVQSVSSMK